MAKPQSPPPLVLTAGPCPGGCGRPIPASKFLCNPCADAAGDSVVVRLASAMDAGNAESFSAALSAVPSVSRPVEA